MMSLDEIRAGMNEYEVADALLLAPFSHPDVWRKRTAELRSQGRDDEAAIVETEHSGFFTKEHARDVERIGAALTRTFNRLS